MIPEYSTFKRFRGEYNAPHSIESQQSNLIDSKKAFIPWKKAGGERDQTEIIIYPLLTAFALLQRDKAWDILLKKSQKNEQVLYFILAADSSKKIQSLLSKIANKTDFK